MPRGGNSTEAVQLKSTRCHVCLSPFKDQVNLALMGGATLKAVAKKYSLSFASVKGHKYSCLRRAMADETKGLDLGSAAAGLAKANSRLESLIVKNEFQLNQAEESKDWKLAQQCIRTGKDLIAACHEQIRIIGEISGELGKNAQPAGSVNIAKAIVVMPRTADLAHRKPLELAEHRSVEDVLAELDQARESES